MPSFPVGAPLPPSVWDDYRRGSSLGSDLLRLTGAGLTGFGALKRQQEKEAQERADEESRFSRTLALKQAELARKSTDDEDRWDEVEPGVFAPARTTVPQMRATGQRMMERGVSPAVDAGIDQAMQMGGLFGGPATGGGPTVDETRALMPQAAETPSRTGRQLLRGLTAKQASFLRQQQASLADDERLAGASEATRRNMAEDNLRAQEAAAAKKRQESESEAARRVAVRFFQDPTRELTPEEADIVSKDPSTAPFLAQAAERTKTRLFREQEAKAKAEKATADEMATWASARSQAVEIAKRAQDTGVDVEVPDFYAPDGKPMPAKEVIRRVTAMEKNYDDAFRAKMAEETKSLMSDKTLDADRRRTAQHQVDAFERQVAAKRKVVDEFNQRLAQMEAFDPGSSAGSPIAKAARDAIDGLNRTLKARDAAYRVIGRLVGLENIVDPETGMPMAEPPAPQAEGLQQSGVDMAETRAAFVETAEALGYADGSPEAAALAARFKAKPMPATFADKAEANAWLEAVSEGMDAKSPGFLALARRVRARIKR